MQQVYNVVLLLSQVIIVTQCYECNENPYCETYTPSGIIRGGYNTTRYGRIFESYRGIRYAEPPVGDLRFQPPQLIQMYKDPVDATNDGPVCPQANFTGPFQFMDEDCLRINVYTPLKKDRTHLLPVIVYIHPSAFYVGAACSFFYGASYLLDRDVVLVTFNYRLGSLGFISTGDENAPGNNGLKDQVAALRWVQRNIAAFGGDPNCVTIAGYSSGSTSVAVHLVSPMSKGLFHRAISMSGSPLLLVKTPTDQYKYAVKQAQLVNCPTYNSKILIECLKTKPWRDIAKSYSDFYIFGKNPKHLWIPIVEKDFGQERFLTMDPIDAIKNGKINNVPYIISQNEAEYFPYALPILENNTMVRQLNEDWFQIAPIVLLLPEENITAALSELRSIYFQNRPLQKDDDSIDRLGNLYGDAIVALPVNRLVQLICRYSSKPVWYLYFTYVGNNSYYSDPVTGYPKYAVHQDEVLYLFDVLYRFPRIGTTGEDARMVDRMTAIFYNLANYGDPNPREDTTELKGLVWPPMTPENRTYLQLSKDLTLHQNLKEKRLQIWDQLYPIEY